MKNLFKIFLFLFAVSQTVVAQGQTSEPKDWIWQSEGIPIIGNVDWRWWGYHHAVDVKKMSDSAGVDAVMLDIYPNTIQHQMDTLDIFGFKGIPIRSAGYNYIQHYTDAKYSVWEAEGNDNYDVNLEYNSSVMDELTDGDTTFLKLKHTAAALQDTALIFGPYYSQDVKYLASQDSVLQIIEYLAEFSLKLEHNPYYPISDDPEDTICVIQVTQSSVPTAWIISCTDTIKERVLRREDFAQLNRFYNFLLHPDPDSANYTLENDICDSPDLGPPPVYTFHSYFSSDTLVPGPRWIKPYIQLKVIWKGDQHYLLSIDKITVSDQRGRDLKFQTFPTNQILAQANSLNSYNADGLITGWLGIDEPVSIDLFEPIRIVKDILDYNSQGKRPLWIAMMGHWDGAWENRENPFGAQGKSPWNELKNRIGRVNIIQNAYMFDSPCYPGSPSSACNTGEDYRSINIWRTALLNYKRAYELDPFYGVSLQCGAVKNTQANERNVARQELLYNANLALMFGAKFFHLYSYFAQRAPGDSLSGWTYHGIVDRQENFYAPLIYTDKYFMLKNTLSPRLKGLFGKTLKKLTPTEQYLNHTLSSSEGFIQSIIKGGCTVQGMQPSDEAYDLGFFKDDLDQDYFMLISRWYNSGCNPALTININPVYFPDNYNLKVVNLINNTTLNTITKYGYIYSAPEVGDACFFSIAPVVKYGGLLAYNDTIKVNTTLSDNMTIDAGKVLQINEGKTYTITDTITFTDTSSFITGYGYVNRTQSGWITTRSWNRSLFKGRSGSHPKLIWSKHPDITNVIDYKIYRNHSNGGWQYLTTKSSNIFEYIDSTITIIEGMPQANETSTQYRVTATYRPSKLVIETSPTNTILYHRVEGQGLEKQSSGLTSNDFTFNLDQNYPNPFNPSTTISYSIAEDGIVNLEILNILGERIKTLVNDFKTRGNHNISFNASSLASGVYVYKLQAGDFVSSRKMILLK